MRTAALFAVLLVAVPTLDAGGQPPRRPGGQFPGMTGPRDRGEPATGTARLRGLVVGGETAQPLRRAIVRVMGSELRAGRIAVTDEQGRWELRDLPAGRFNVTASKAGYVTLEYGQRRAFEPGKPIELADGQAIENVSFNLPRGAVIAGRIVDEFGDPVAEAMVNVMRYSYFNGQRRLVPAGRFAMTDDGGLFRVYGLAPGNYYVSATLRQGFGGFAEVEDATGYAPTYYPGTGSVAQASAVTVQLGGEVSGLTFALLPVRTARVSGTAMDSSGKPMAGAMVMLTESSEGEAAFMRGMGGGRVENDGSFRISNVAPGTYTIVAREMGRRGETEMATAEVTVASEDVSGVTLVAAPPATLRGRVMFDVEPLASVQPESVSLLATSRNPATAPMMMGGRPDRVNEDWTFELTAIQGPVLIRSLNLPRGYSLKGVYHNGVDVTDTGIAFQPNQTVTGLQVVLTARQAAVAGAVANADGESVLDYSVVVFAEDPAFWGFMSRRVAMGRPDQQGQFQVKDLPAGKYLAVAVDYVESGQHTDPEFLERMRPLATAFDLSDGEQRALNLKLVTN